MIEYIDPRVIYREGPKKKLMPEERQVLRTLAAKVCEYAHDPCQQEKRRLWYAHNCLERIRPMVLVFPEGAWLEILPWESMVCQDEFYKAYEWVLRRLCYRYEHFHDDFVIEPVLEVYPVYEITPFIDGGVSLIHMDMDGREKSLHIAEPLLKEENDIEKLKRPEFIYHNSESLRNLEAIRDVVGDLIEVKLYGYMVPDTSLLRQFIEMRGAQQIFFDLYDRPEWLHQVLGFMRDSTLSLLEAMEPYVRDTNTGNDYIGSGGLGYTKELKEAGSNIYQKCWGFSDAQELVGVSPEMYEEFATAYHQPILEKFGLSCYGCCEPMTDKFDIIKNRIKNLRRVSVNPWTDREVAAAALKDRYIFSWKPAPTAVTHGFDPQNVRRDIGWTMDVAKDCVVEMILKDTVTIGKQPERISCWIDIAKEYAQKGYV